MSTASVKCVKIKRGKALIHPRQSTRKHGGRTFREARGYLPSRRASAPFGQYQIILLGNRGACVTTTCPESLQWKWKKTEVTPATFRSFLRHPGHYTAMHDARNRSSELNKWTMNAILNSPCPKLGTGRTMVVNNKTVMSLGGREQRLLTVN